MGILGIYASSVLKITNSYESIATVTVGSGGSSTITFSSIPSTFKHLQVRLIGRTSFAGSGGGIDALARFNSDSGSNYDIHRLGGNGSSASAGAATSQTYARWGYMSRGGDLANTFAVSVIDILDYTNTNKNKTVRILNGEDFNGSGDVSLFSNLWRSTAAINTITISPDSSNWAQYTHAALYGIKG